jgi:hypothetical protein
MIQLTEKQQEIIDSPARVKLAIGGYRSGKTILAIMNLWNNMKQFNSPSFRGIFLVNSDSLVRYSLREFKRVLPAASITAIMNEHGNVLIKTKLGRIVIAKELVPVNFDNITIDNASSNKYANPEILKAWSKIYITGHLPDDIDNQFFKWWLKEYFSDTDGVSAFRITETFMDVHGKEGGLISVIGINRFNRGYNAIPDYVDYGSEERRQQMYRREYLAEFTDKIENSEIGFDFKAPYSMGFDKAKE